MAVRFVFTGRITDMGISPFMSAPSRLRGQFYADADVKPLVSHATPVSAFSSRSWPIRKNAIAWDMRLVRWLGRMIIALIQWYPKPRSFILAHRWLYVRPQEYRKRWEKCMHCRFAYQHKGHRYCRGDNGGLGCGCGHWKGSRLKYKIALAARRCPQGRFGLGGLALLAHKE